MSVEMTSVNAAELAYGLPDAGRSYALRLQANF